MTEAIMVLVLAMLASVAVAVARLRSLFAAAMLMGIYSLLGAGWMMLLDAPDVAFTEASVGAGISTVLVLAALSLTTSREKKPEKASLLPLVLVSITGAALVYGTLDMPRFGDPDAPAHRHVAPRYILESPREIGVPNIITSVLASYRGYDTLGETTVIFTAGVGVMILLAGARRRRPFQDEEEEA